MSFSSDTFVPLEQTLRAAIEQARRSLESGASSPRVLQRILALLFAAEDELASLDQQPLAG